jgi:hypothetical protein
MRFQPTPLRCAARLKRRPLGADCLKQTFGDIPSRESIRWSALKGEPIMSEQQRGYASNDSIKKAMTSVEYYFDHGCDTSVIRGTINQYGEYVVYSGLEVIVARVRSAVQETMTPYFISRGEEGDKYVINTGLQLVSCLGDATLMLGERGIAALESIVNGVSRTSSQHGDDLASLAAYLLCMQGLIASRSLNPLKHAFQQAYGTGVKMALAYSIFTHEDSKQNREQLKYFLREYCGYDDVERTLQNMFSGTAQHLERILLIELTFPGATDKLPREWTQRWPGAFGLVVMDIATDGQAIMRRWERKHF